MEIKMIPIVPESFGDLPKLFVSIFNATRDASNEGLRMMTEYPPTESDSYVRTGTLRKSWGADVKSGGKAIEGEVFSNVNIAPYNEEVQGADQDSFFFQRGWANVNDLVEKLDRNFPERVQKEVDKAFA